MQGPLKLQQEGVHDTPEIHDEESSWPALAGHTALVVVCGCHNCVLRPLRRASFSEELSLPGTDPTRVASLPCLDGSFPQKFPSIAQGGVCS
jgi:hypothetical protein